MKLKIIYEDNHIIVVEKPVNIPSQGDKTGDEDTCQSCHRPDRRYRRNFR